METMSDQIQPGPPRDTIEVHLPDGRVLSGPRDTQAGDFLRADPVGSPYPTVGAIVNGELHELTYRIRMDSSLKPVTMKDEEASVGQGPCL